MSYEEEIAGLAVWLRGKTQEYFDAVEEERRRNKAHGLDSKLDALHSEDVAEYNRRLVLLKAKYGKELSAG